MSDDGPMKDGESGDQKPGDPGVAGTMFECGLGGPLDGEQYRVYGGAICVDWKGRVWEPQFSYRECPVPSWVQGWYVDAGLYTYDDRPMLIWCPRQCFWGE